MKQSKKTGAFATAMIFLSALFASCDDTSGQTGSTENPFIGSWAYEQAEPEGAGLAAGTYVYAFTETTYTLKWIDPEGGPGQNNAAGTYTYDATTITMTVTKRLAKPVVDPVPVTMSYRIHDAILTLTDDGTGSTDYQKQ